LNLSQALLEGNGEYVMQYELQVFLKQGNVGACRLVGPSDPQKTCEFKGVWPHLGNKEFCPCYTGNHPTLCGPVGNWIDGPVLISNLNMSDKNLKTTK
jgi:hypothetical protein